MTDDYPRNSVPSLSRRGGFTLVELIVALVILAVLAAILVPTLTGYISQASNERDYSTAAELQQAAQATVIEQKQKHPSWTYENLNPIASTDELVAHGNTAEKDYVLQLADVGSSKVDWFYFNIDENGAVTPTIMQNATYATRKHGRNTNSFPTAVCLDGSVYYLQGNGSWASAVMNDDGSFTCENVSYYNYANGQTSTDSGTSTWRKSGNAFTRAS